MPLIGLIAISGFFGSKNEDLDILPPPPPFPDIGIDKPKDAAEDEWKRSKQRIEEDRKTRMEFERQKSIEKKKEDRRKKQEEIQKKLLEKQKKSDAKKEKIKIPKPIGEKDEGRIELPKPEQKKSFFGKLFGKKDEELEKELEELEEIKPWAKEPRLITKKLPELKIPEAGVKAPKPIREKIEPIKDISEIELPEIKIKESVKPLDLEKAQEEIRKSIESMQREKREPSIGRLFRKKEKEEVMEKIETPEVMPRTFDKIDHVQEIEERIHKARMCLMDFKFDDAKMIYIDIMRRYNDLESKDKSKVYDDIRDLYYERKGAEKFAKV